MTFWRPKLGLAHMQGCRNSFEKLGYYRGHPRRYFDSDTRVKAFLPEL